MTEEEERKVWLDGYDSFAVSKEDKDANPHKKSTFEYGMWLDGWFTAQEDDNLSF